NFPLITGKSNYSKRFISRGFDLGSKRGVIGFLHAESVYDDPNGGQFRVEMFYRLLYHFQFLNELLLFAEVDHHTKFSINIYQSRRKKEIFFENIVNLFHPKTIDASYSHDGAGVVPGIKDELESWEVRGHKARVVFVDDAKIAFYRSEERRVGKECGYRRAKE